MTGLADRPIGNVAVLQTKGGFESAGLASFFSQRRVQFYAKTDGNTSSLSSAAWSNKSDRLSKWGITGICIGGIVVLSIGLYAACYYYFRYRPRKSHPFRIENAGKTPFAFGEKDERTSMSSLREAQVETAIELEGI